MKRMVFKMKRHKYTWAEMRARFESENNGLFDKIRKDMEELRDKEVTEEEKAELDAYFKNQTKKAEASLNEIRKMKQEGKLMVSSGVIDISGHK